MKAAARSGRFALRLGGALVAVASSCAAPSDNRTLPDGSLDGQYAGNRTNDPVCGTEVQPVVFHVYGSSIWVDGRHGRHRLEGTVAANGQIAMQDPTGLRHIEGLIRDGVLTATETTTGSGSTKHRRSSLDDPATLTCVWRFNAVRAAADPAAATPP